MGKLDVEKKAMNIVMKYEKKQGRNPKDVSKNRIGYDIKSGGRCIEVKGQSTKRAEWIWINNTVIRKLGKEISNYYVYIVYDINKKPKLKILEPDVIFKNLVVDTMFKLNSKVVNEFGINVE